MFNRITLLILISLISHTMWGQSSILNTPVILEKGIYTQKKIIQSFENNYQIPFSYSDNILFNEAIPIEQAIEAPLKQVLDSIFIPLGYNYELINQQVVLFKTQNNASWVTISGFIMESNSNETLIGATLYVDELKIGAVSNAYGYFAFRLPRGNHHIEIKCLGYQSVKKDIFLWNASFQTLWLEPQFYQVDEVTVNAKEKDQFLESTLSNMSKVDIVSLQNMPGLLGEKDALRNLNILPGVQSNEMSTGSIFVRGGSTDQTIFLMDEALLHTASHFGGFFSVFNPDVVNSVTLYKSNIPASEGGTLSSLIDVRLRDGNNEQWKTKGSLGIISARVSVEGPLIKEKASILVAFRRSYLDQVISLSNSDIRFNFYDANLKLNYRINNNNRIFLSGYTSSDEFNQNNAIWSGTNIATFRWNHLFNQDLFSNVSAIYSQNSMNQSIQSQKYNIAWRSNNTNARFKMDFTHYQSDNSKGKFGASTMFHHIIPNTYISEFEGLVSEDYETQKEQQLQNSVYYTQYFSFANKFIVDAGIRVTQMISTPFGVYSEKFTQWYTEPHLYLSYALKNQYTLKANASHHVQPMHQIPLSTMGISINRFLPASESFKPKTSSNFSVGLFKKYDQWLNYSIEGYYRKMDYLIETLQDMRILTVNNPESYFHPAKGEAFGIELHGSFFIKNFTGYITTNISKVNWLTEGLNNNKPYPASYARENSLVFSGAYQINKRLSVSASWQWASGVPFTAATGKYEVDHKTYLKFDIDKINTQKVPNYHRLDLSVDLKGKKNDIRRWKSFWNLSFYNAYANKNPLGVYYYVPDYDDAGEVQNAILQPSYFYLYQFVPSLSYRFEF